MGGILGYARVSTGDQDVAGQTMRLTQARAIKVFTDVRSGRSACLSRLLIYDGAHLRRVVDSDIEPIPRTSAS